MPIQAFPVDAAAKPTLRDDWHAPRSGGRVHEGIDIFAPKGAPLVAVDDGRVTRAVKPRGGNEVILDAPDGTRYVYAHLSEYPTGPGLALDRVRAGDVVGFVGTSGNAEGGPPHVHFEVYQGGRPVPPLPLLEPFAPPGAVQGRPRRSEGVIVALVLLYMLSRRA